jgi:amidase
LVEQIAAITTKSISSVELLEAFLARIERLNAQLNCVITLDAERAVARAKLADAATARGESWGPLHGIPFTVKDAISTGGLRTTGGARELRDHVPAADATAVARLRAAGGVLFGKTNLPRWSADVQTFNDMFGTTNNPWDLQRTPGGSSGGAAAAVAAGLTAFELGSDIGGSIRMPAHFCGIFGHRPSWGLVPQAGYLDHAAGGVIDADINVLGPLARGAGDLALLLDVLAGPAPEIAHAWSLHLPAARHDSLSGYRIGFWFEDPDAEIDTEVLALLRAAAAQLADAGAQVSGAHPDIGLPESRQLCAQLVGAAASRSGDPKGSRGTGGSHAQWLNRQERRAQLRARWREWFTEYDALLCPVFPVPAFVHDQAGTMGERFLDVNGRSTSQQDLAHAWNGPVGVVGLPSTVVPVGRTRSGLPVGMQVVGPYLEDRTPLALARAVEGLLGGYVPPPLAR